MIKLACEYNFAMFNISSKLKLYGDMLEKKILYTFHASNMLLWQ